MKSKLAMGILAGIGAVVLALLVFRAGVYVGMRKADFSYRWGENYHRNFGGPREGFMPGMFREGEPSAHGAFGKIISLSMPTFTVESSEGVEKLVRIGDGTAIVQFHEPVASSSLAVGDYVVVIGEPNTQGEIEAGLVRVMPAPPLPYASGTMMFRR